MYEVTYINVFGRHVIEEIQAESIVKAREKTRDKGAWIIKEVKPLDAFEIDYCA
jgi:hypothetical protein